MSEVRLSKIREVTAKVDEAERKGIDIVNFSIGRPDFDTPGTSRKRPGRL